MDPVALAALIAQLLPVGIQIYNQIAAANPATVPPLSTILVGADASWDQVAATAQGQLTPPTVS